MFCVASSLLLQIIYGNNSLHDLFWRGRGILIKITIFFRILTLAARGRK